MLNAMKNLFLFPVFAVLLMLTFLGIYINAETYAAVGPFHDSMSYSNQLALIFNSTQQDGFYGFFNGAALGTNVFFPYLTGVPLYSILGPSRILYIFSNVIIFSILLVVYSRYLSIVSSKKGLGQFIFLLSIVGFSGVYSSNGGVSDFRMDLPFALLYGAFVIQFQIARFSETHRGEWIGLGVIAACASLNRATAPVFILIFSLPIFVLDMRFHRCSLKYYVLAFSVVMALSGWYYFFNFKYLYFYYVSWNTDAHANLPISEAIKHIGFFVNHVGGWLLPFLLGAISIVHAYRRSFWTLLLRDTHRAIFLWGFTSPILYLIISGSGLNPYITLIAVVPFICFTNCSILLPNIPHVRYKLACFLMGLGLFITMVMNMGNQDSKYPQWIPSANSVKELTSLLVLNGENRRNYCIAFPFQGSVGPDSVINSAIYDFKLTYNGNREVISNGSHITFKNTAPDSEVLWRALPGVNDSEKIDSIISDASTCDYVVLAAPSSKLPLMDHLKINKYIDVIYNGFASNPNFITASANIHVTSDQDVVIFKRKE